MALVKTDKVVDSISFEIEVCFKLDFIKTWFKLFVFEETLKLGSKACKASFLLRALLPVLPSFPLFPLLSSFPLFPVLPEFPLLPVFPLLSELPELSWFSFWEFWLPVGIFGWSPLFPTFLKINTPTTIIIKITATTINNITHLFKDFFVSLGELLGVSLLEFSLSFLSVDFIFFL